MSKSSVSLVHIELVETFDFVLLTDGAMQTMAMPRLMVIRMLIKDRKQHVMAMLRRQLAKSLATNTN